MPRATARLMVLALLVISACTLTACNRKAKSERVAAKAQLEAFGEAKSDRDVGTKALLAGSLALQTARETGGMDEGPCQALEKKHAKLEDESGAKGSTATAKLRAAMQASPKFDAQGNHTGNGLAYAGLTTAVTLMSENCWTRMTK